MSALLREDDVDKLIDEIEKRPPLYLKSLKEYADINLKKKLWDEVYSAVIENWNSLSPQEKNTQGKLNVIIYKHLNPTSAYYIKSCM